MPLYESVCSRETRTIAGAEWELHVKEGRPVGVCQDCGSDLFGEARQIYYGTVYRDVRCRKGHERTIPGNVFQGPIVTRPDVLQFNEPRHLRPVPD